MLKKTLLLFALILPVFCFCQTEKGVWAINGTFNFNKLSKREVPRLYEENRNFAVNTNIGLHIKDNFLFGIKCKYEKSYPLSIPLWRQEELDFQLYFKRYFGENKIRFFGIIEGGYFKRKTFYDTVLTKDEKIFASAIGIGTSYFLSPNVALELQFSTTSFEKQNSILKDFYIKTDILLFLNSKRPYQRDINWKFDYLDKGNIILGLSSNFGIIPRRGPDIINIQPSFSILFREAFRWKNTFQFRHQSATENRQFRGFEYRTSFEYIDLLMNNDWLLYELGTRVNTVHPSRGEEVAIFTSFGIRFAEKRSIFFDIKIEAEFASGTLKQVGEHLNLFMSSGFETFFYQNLTFECKLNGFLFDIIPDNTYRRSGELSFGYGLQFGFNYYLLRNKNQSN